MLFFAPKAYIDTSSGRKKVLKSKKTFNLIANLEIIKQKMEFSVEKISCTAPNCADSTKKRAMVGKIKF